MQVANVTTTQTHQRVLIVDIDGREFSASREIGGDWEVCRKTFRGDFYPVRADGITHDRAMRAVAALEV